jgi:hypothetical protein
MSVRLSAVVPLLALIGCGKDDGEPVGELDVSPATVEFGRISEGSSSSQEFVITNVGTGDVDVLSIALTSGDADVWTVSGSGALLAPGDLIVVTVTFAPEEEQQYYGAVTIRTDLDEDVMVQLSGVGGAFEGDRDGDGVNATEDCDDDDVTVYPGAPEICDGQDNDCDGSPGPDEGDGDSDGHPLCEDCNDGDPSIGPGDDHVEVCDGVDQDCDGVIDEVDADLDGHSPCSFAGDCDDADPLAYPIYVNRASTAESPDGTDAAPFSNLSDAIDALDAICREIAVAPGNYTVGEVLPTGTLTIRGSGRDQTVIVPEAGAPAFTMVSGDYAFSDLAFQGGASTDDGGALRVLDSTLVIERADFDDNAAVGDGGAIYAERTSLTVLDSAFARNLAGDRGGAIFLSGETTASFDIAGNTFWLNRAATGGGAVYLLDVDESGATIRNNVFADDEGIVGAGGIEAAGDVAAIGIVNNTFFSEAGSGDGGCVGVTATDASGLVFSNNVALLCGGSAGVYLSGGTGAYNTVWGTSSGRPDFGGALADGSDGNVSEDPELYGYSDDGDPGNDDLKPAPGSPLVDSGDPAPEWNDPDGSRNDRGYTGGPEAR